MSEISREDAIMNIKSILDLWNNEYDLKAEYRDFLEDDPIATLGKSISDMEKLEKIEEVISAMENTDDETVESFAFREIEQIVKG